MTAAVAGTGRKPGPPAHDDLVDQRFTGVQPKTSGSRGKLCLCAVKDACIKRIVGNGRPLGHGSGSRCDHRRDSAAPSGRVGGALRSRQPVPFPRVRPSPARGRPERLHGLDRRMRGLRCDGVLLQLRAEGRAQPPTLTHPPGTPRHRHPDREHRPPPKQARQTRTPDTCRVRGTAKRRSRGLTNTAPNNNTLGRFLPRPPEPADTSGRSRPRSLAMVRCVFVFAELNAATP